MKRYLALIFFFWFSASNAETPIFISQAPTPLKFSKVGQYEVAYFKGKVQVEGNFIAGWEEKGGPPYELIVSFYPTKKSAMRLPFPRDSYPPEVIVFSNEKQAAKLLLSPSKYLLLMSEEHKYSVDDLMNGAQFKSYKGFAKVTIDSYQTAVECDSRWYKARLLSVEPPSIKLSTSQSGQRPC